MRIARWDFFTVQQFDICCFRSVMKGLLQLSFELRRSFCINSDIVRGVHSYWLSRANCVELWSAGAAPWTIDWTHIRRNKVILWLWQYICSISVFIVHGSCIYFGRPNYYRKGWIDGIIQLQRRTAGLLGIHINRACWIESASCTIRMMPLYPGKYDLTMANNDSTSVLSVNNVQLNDSGLYGCSTCDTKSAQLGDGWK